MELRVDVGRVWTVLLAAVGVLVAGHVVGMVFIHGLGHDHVFGLVPMFSLDGESNLPAWFSGGILAFSALLLLITALAERRRGEPWIGWMGLAVIFAFLSLDEVAVVHERLGWAAGDLAGAEGTLQEYAWVAVYLPVVALIGLAYLRFLARLAPPIRNGMLLAALLYVGGAAGIEVLGSPFWNDDATQRGWPYLALVGVEETLEMLGIAVFIRTILRYDAQERLTLVFAEAGTGAPAADVAAAADAREG